MLRIFWEILFLTEKKCRILYDGYDESDSKRNVQ